MGNSLRITRNGHTQKTKITKTLLKSQFWLIDGANGSEIINSTKYATADFGALTAYKYPEAVLEVHKSYVEAGANFITVNTYSANYNVLNAIRFGSHCQVMIENAVDLAEKSTKESKTTTFIVGSISEHPPFDESGKVCWPVDEKDEIENFEKTLIHLFDQNIDCLFLELIRTEKHGLLLIKALSNIWQTLSPSKKVPVFLGVVPQINLETKLIFQRSEAQKTGRNEERYQELTFSKFNLSKFIDALVSNGVDLVGVNLI